MPVAVVLLAGGLLAAYCLRRRRMRMDRQQMHQKQGLLDPCTVAPAGAAAARDLEVGPDSGALLVREGDQVSCHTWLGLAVCRVIAVGVSVFLSQWLLQPSATTARLRQGLACCRVCGLSLLTCAGVFAGEARP